MGVQHVNSYQTNCSLVPGPTLLLLFGCVDNNTRRQKSGDNGEGLGHSSRESHQVDARWMWEGSGSP